MNSEVDLSVQHFRKTYGSLVAVDDISFTVKRGEIFGLLGPNGAGKTSTLESLEGLRKPDGGRLNILGVDPARQPQKLRNLIGVQLQSSGLPPMMTVEEAMQFFCAYHDVAPRMDLIERLGLTEKRRDQFNLLSAGQQRRLALGMALAVFLTFRLDRADALLWCLALTPVFSPIVWSWDFVLVLPLLLSAIVRAQTGLNRGLLLGGYALCTTLFILLRSGENSDHLAMWVPLALNAIVWLSCLLRPGGATRRMKADA